MLDPAHANPGRVALIVCLHAGIHHGGVRVFPMLLIQSRAEIHHSVDVCDVVLFVCVYETAERE